MSRVPLHEPVFAGNEWRYLKECLDTGWVSSAGAFVDRFERETAERMGCRRAVAVTTGTAALHLALEAAGVGAGDEVLVPSLTFIATANAPLYLGAKPRFVDCEDASLGMDPSTLAEWFERETELLPGGGRRTKDTGRRIAACVPMHVFGLPCRIDELAALCARNGIALVEDAAESLGSFWKGRAAGSFGIAGCLSFNGNKTLTTGGGGMVVTDSDAVADRVRHLSTQSKKNAATYLHDELGWNYRMPNLNAALGCAQLEQLDAFLARKRAIAERYRAGLAGVRGLSLLWEAEGGRSNFWLNAVRAETPERAAALLSRLNAAGVEARPVWTPGHLQPHLGTLATGSLSRAENAWKTVVNLPSGAGLTDAQVDRTLEVLRA